MSATQRTRRFSQNGCGAPTWPPRRGGHGQNIQGVGAWERSHGRDEQPGQTILLDDVKRSLRTMYKA